MKAKKCSNIYTNKESNLGRSDCVDNKERFLQLCSQVKRDGMDRLLAWLEKSDFFTAPASSRFHGAYEGGLLQHSLNVYDEFKRLIAVYPEVKCDEESIVICTLFHDLCKVGMYTTEKRNRKNADGQWETYDAYKIEEKFCFGGHGSKSVYMLMRFIDLKPAEATAINNHMSAFGGDVNSIGRAFEQYPFAWLLSVADQSATYILEGDKDNG